MSPAIVPITLATTDASTSAILAHALYRPSVDHLSLGSSAGTLSFDNQDQSGLGARKTFHFRPDGKPYIIGFDASIDLAGKTQPVTVSWGPALGLGYMPDGSREPQPAAGIFERNGKVERPAAQDAGRNTGPQRHVPVRRRVRSLLRERRLSRSADGQAALRADLGARAE